MQCYTIVLSGTSVFIKTSIDNRFRRGYETIFLDIYLLDLDSY